MAKTLTAFPDEDESQSRARYPWDKWLDGQVWELRHGTREQVEQDDADFSVGTKSFTSAVKQAAKPRNGDARIAYKDDKTTVIVQFVKSAPVAESPGE